MAQVCNGCLATVPRTTRGMCGLCNQRDNATRRPPASERYPAEYRRNRAALIGQPCALHLPGCTGTADTADHITPRARGGNHGPENLQPACQHCNSRKAALNGRTKRAPQS